MNFPLGSESKDAEYFRQHLMSIDLKLPSQDILHSDLTVSGYSHGGPRGSFNLFINMQLDLHM